MEWNLKRIQNEVNDFAEHTRKVLGKDIYETTKELESCQITISTRMTVAKGKFEFRITKAKGKTTIEPVGIKISKSLLNDYHDEDIIQTIRHECVHFIVNVYKQENHGHDKMFKQYCKMLGISDETYFTAKAKVEERYIGKCQKCGYEYRRNRLRKSTFENWIHNCHCHKCHGELHIIDTKEQVEYMKGKNHTIKKISLKSKK